MEANAKRGYVPEDARNFSPEALEKLKKASRHILYLMEEGYDAGQASTFVGNHFLLSERQRLAILRSVAVRESLAKRKEKLVPLTDLSGKEVWMDGFNQVITMEVLLNSSLLFLGMDGAIRDLASLRGTYRILPETREAIGLLFAPLKERGAVKGNVLLDKPVSNSGRLKSLMAEVGEELAFPLDIQLLPQVDQTLYEKENVLTTDSVILDRCHSWVNLGREVISARGGRCLQVW